MALTPEPTAKAVGFHHAQTCAPAVRPPTARLNGLDGGRVCATARKATTAGEAVKVGHGRHARGWRTWCLLGVFAVRFVACWMPIALRLGPASLCKSYPCALLDVGCLCCCNGHRCLCASSRCSPTAGPVSGKRGGYRLRPATDRHTTSCLAHAWQRLWGHATCSAALQHQTTALCVHAKIMCSSSHAGTAVPIAAETLFVDDDKRSVSVSDKRTTASYTYDGVLPGDTPAGPTVRRFMQFAVPSVPPAPPPPRVCRPLTQLGRMHGDL